MSVQAVRINLLMQEDLFLELMHDFCSNELINA